MLKEVINERCEFLEEWIEEIEAEIVKNQKAIDEAEPLFKYIHRRVLTANTQLLEDVKEKLRRAKE